MKFLGIDFGSKRVGIAVSDEAGTLAFPKTVLKNDKSLASVIKKICADEKADALVVGESLNLKGEPNKLQKEISIFKKELENELKVPVYFQKEFMTSIEARRPKEGKKIFSARKLPKEKAIKTDASAAALILQRYLDKLKANA